MKVIDLLNKIANGKEVPKRIRIDSWCYEFEWVEHLNNYYDKQADIDFMSVLSCDKEELNYEVHELKQEDKKIERLKNLFIIPDRTNENLIILVDKINEIIDKINKD